MLLYVHNYQYKESCTMSYYHTAQICLNGHIINESIEEYPEKNEKFCSLCGSETITECPSC